MYDTSLSKRGNNAWDSTLTNCIRTNTIKMIKVIPLDSFTKWINGLNDESIKAIIAARIDRLRHGLMGDVESVGSGVLELRIHVGAGWRVYFTRHQGDIIILLAGGSKRTQSRDIKVAKSLAERL